MAPILSSLKKSGLLVLFLISLACSKKKVDSENATVTATPPSVSLENLQAKVVVSLTEQEARELNIPLFETEMKKQDISITAPGEVFAAPNYIAMISAPLEGRILGLPVAEGQTVQKGQVLLEMESLSYGSLVGDYLQAVAEENYQKNQLERITQLVSKGINTESELEKIKADYSRAKASNHAAYAKLRAVGASDSEINGFSNEERINPVLKILCPINGIIDTHQVELGKAVATNEQIATVINLEKILIRAYLTPEDGKLVHPGDTVNIFHRLVEEASMKAQVATINPGLDEMNRSIVVNILLDNKNQWFKPGDNVRTIIQTQTQKDLLAIPTDAISYNNDDPVVFVSLGDQKYELRAIHIAEIRDKLALVSSGLSAGEKVAIGQVFSLKALARFELISEE